MGKRLFVGSASENLGRKIAKLNGWRIGKKEVVRFANSEVRVTIMEKVNGQDVWVVQTTANPSDNNIMELLLTIDALRREGSKNINCIIPYFGYARQNKQHRSGECVSAHVVIKLLEEVGADKIVAADLHDESIAGIFSIPFLHVSALPYLAKQVSEKLGLNDRDKKNFIVGTPDQGGLERSRVFAETFYNKTEGFETIVVEKKRDLDKIHQSYAVELFGNVEGKSVILVDDIATSGGTLINAATLCLEHGAKDVYAVIAHADFALGTAEKIQNSKITKLFTTNTIEKPVENLQPYSKIEVIDIAPIFKLS